MLLTTEKKIFFVSVTGSDESMKIIFYFVAYTTPSFIIHRINQKYRLPTKFLCLEPVELIINFSSEYFLQSTF